MINVSTPGRFDWMATSLLGALLLAVPLLHSGAFSDPFTLPKELAMLAAALVLPWLAIVSRLRGDAEPVFLSPVFPLALATSLLAAAAIAPSANHGLAAAGFARIAAGVVLFWSVPRFVNSTEAAARLLQATLLASALVALGTLLQVFVPGMTLSILGVSILPPTRAGSTVGDPGLAVQFLIVGLPAAIGAVAFLSGIRRLLGGLCLGLVAAALLFAGRPEGWRAAGWTAAILLASRVYQVARSDRQWSRLAPDLAGDGLRTALVALITVVAILAASRATGLFGAAGATSPLDGVSLLSPTTGDPAIDRAAALRGSLHLIRLHPAGVGASYWRHAFLEVAWEQGTKSPFTLTHQAVHAGNNFIERAAEIGVAGGLAFALLIGTLLLQAGIAMARAPRPWDAIAWSVFGVIAAASVVAFLGEPFEEPGASLLVWILGGLAPVALGHAPRPATLPRLLWPAARAPRGIRGAYAAGILWLAVCLLTIPWSWRRAEASRLAQRGLGSHYTRQYREALSTLELDASRRSPDPLPRIWAGEASLRLGRSDQAIEEFGAAIARSPWFLSAYLGRALAHQDAGHYDLAQNDLEAALRIWGDNVDTLLALARLTAIRGRLDDSLEEYRRIVSMNPSLAEPYFQMGVIYLRRDRLDEAIEAFRICGMKNPRYPKLQITTGDAFYRKGLIEMALRAYQAAASENEQDVDARLKIASAQHTLLHYCDAQEALEAARDLEADTDRRTAILQLIQKVEPDCIKEKKAKAGKTGARR
jgi:tetratricopeptide (TPR) repeat protein